MSRNTARTRKLDRLAEEATIIRRTAELLAHSEFCGRGDELLVEFQAAPEAERRERWAQLDEHERQALAWASVRSIDGLGWNAPVSNRLWVMLETLAARWELLPSDQRAIDAMTNLAEEADRAAELTPVAKEQSPLRSLARAYRTARRHYLLGLRPIQQPDGSWLVPSATSTGRYAVSREAVCSCPRGVHGGSCWHAAAVTAIDWANVLMEGC